MLFKWDWYQATLMPDISLAEFRSDLSVMLGEPKIYRGLKGYDICEDWTHLKIQTGGPSGIWGPHVMIHGGDLCERLVWHLRHYFPDHRVSRFDVCIDFCSVGAFDWALTRAYDVLNLYGLRPSYAGDWYSGFHGRTLYLGSRTSTHFCRLYEKGKQLRESNSIPDADTDWIRIEFEVKPSKSKRLIASKMTPDEVAFSSEWCSDFSSIITLPTDAVEFVSLSTMRKKTRAMQSLTHMFHQYATVIKKAVSDGDISPDDLHAALDQCIKTGNFTEFKFVLDSQEFFDPHSSSWLPVSSIQSRALNKWVLDGKPKRKPNLISKTLPRVDSRFPSR